MFVSRDAATVKNDANKSPRIRKTDTELDSVKQRRALVTRQQLLDSARSIFVRDGFQHARIEDIASRAGKTRGAFYANFKDKEDVFFALFEEEMARDVASLRPVLQHISSLEERIDALTDHLVKLCKERQRILLNLEFKMYAIRHPNRRKRLANLHAVMRQRCTLPEIDDLLPQPPVKDPAKSLAIGAIMEGLAISRFFDPGSLTDNEIKRYLAMCLHEKLRVPGSIKSA